MLFGVDYPNPDAGYASGGYMADSYVTGTLNAGSQQQWFSRNVDMATWGFGAWNFVFVGCPNAPAQHCGKTGALPVTKVDSAPLIAEKPYLVSNAGKF